jgi:hypothetical protein
MIAGLKQYAEKEEAKRSPYMMVAPHDILDLFMKIAEMSDEIRHLREFEQKVAEQIRSRK